MSEDIFSEFGPALENTGTYGMFYAGGQVGSAPFYAAGVRMKGPASLALMATGVAIDGSFNTIGTKVAYDDISIGTVAGVVVGSAAGLLASTAVATLIVPFAWEQPQLIPSTIWPTRLRVSGTSKTQTVASAEQDWSPQAMGVQWFQRTAAVSELASEEAMNSMHSTR